MIYKGLTPEQQKNIVLTRLQQAEQEYFGLALDKSAAEKLREDPAYGGQLIDITKRMNDLEVIITILQSQL